MKSDRDEQCKVIYSATLLGQLAAEDLDDTREKYKKLAKDVWFNMKEREKTLKIARNEVEKLWANCRSLVRVEVYQKKKKNYNNLILLVNKFNLIIIYVF